MSFMMRKGWEARREGKREGCGRDAGEGGVWRAGLIW